MSNELVPCHSCGATRGNALAVWEIRGEGWRVGCVNEECMMAKVLTKPYPTEGEAIAAWNRRFVCHDKYGKPVYAGNEVDLVAGDRFERCHRGCIVTSLRDPRHGYGLVAKSQDSDFTTHTFYPYEIELIESESEE